METWMEYMYGSLQFVFLLLMKHLKMITNTRKKISVIWTYFLWSQSDIVLIWTYFLWSQSDIVLIWTYFLWSQSDIVLILILKLICQCDVKHIMMLLIKDKNISFEGLNKHYNKYHSLSNQTHCDRSDNVCLNLQSDSLW